MLKSFKASQILFQQGDAAADVLRVVEGTVEIVRKIGRNQMLIDTVAPGGFVGALGLVLGQPRGTTAQAASAVTVEALTREEFLHHIRSDPDAAEALIERASARLRGADDQLLEAIRGELDGAVRTAKPMATSDIQPTEIELAPSSISDEIAKAAGAPAANASARPVPAVEIKAATASLVALIGADPIPVVKLPFMIGRMADKREQDMIVEPDLPLQEPPPHHLSRRHFLIYAQDGALYLRDLESTLGTTVNGVSIGRKCPSNVAALEPGENRVTAGDADSSYLFVINVG